MSGPDSYTDNVWKHTKGNVNKKLERARPYNFFLTPVDANKSTHTEALTLSFPELLDKSLGELTDSMHINFAVELGWLFAQYHITDQRGKPITLLYEHCDQDINALQAKRKIPNLHHAIVKPKNAFGHHHTKLSIFSYNDGSIRIVVMTANLREADWLNLTQGIWVSPKFPLKDKNSKSDGDSKTGFKKDILRYLRSYNLPLIRQWIQKIEETDFSEANVFFISSVPGKYYEPIWGQSYLKSILKTHVCLSSGTPSDWPIIAQCSSLGSMGKSDRDWLTTEFVKNLSASTHIDRTTNNVPFNLIYPTIQNVIDSWDGPLGALTCLPYTSMVHKNQTWLEKYMCKWVSNSRKRTKAIPHIKTYCRVSQDCTEMSWFLLTSANLSKAAWGKKTLSDQSDYILSYEAGVLFVPQFLTGCDTFSLNHNQHNFKSPAFSLPFDLPLLSYYKNDQPWVSD
ncbi:Tyrosyl-DNA phosphodiesterase I,Tyrosyl-DNA phosphodiesterase C-terminal domain [Cinara cedri]|uniref:Tyrosyl-DNA phosphodiesterase I,Tyrosyl-DNA phosphodiesterase C-terminal domain n=1 Tax=Cinara cedri TaxID=506608 RepID=A0A5E4NI50_9HEMI|nr:Tyrosyl-DNA phosphodiesterase I,Tyrosyl-DNA phosphodiesterase C-terminal domain [Cinara cedri]